MWHSRKCPQIPEKCLSYFRRAPFRVRISANDLLRYTNVIARIFKRALSPQDGTYIWVNLKFKQSDQGLLSFLFRQAFCEFQPLKTNILFENRKRKVFEILEGSHIY